MRVGRRRFLLMAGGAGASVLLGRRTRPRAVTRRARALGAEVSITAVHPDARDAERALDAAFAALEEVERVASLYRPDSQLRRLNAAGRLRRPHPHLVRLLTRARRFSERTDGAFDVTVQPLWMRDRSATVGWRRLSVTSDAVVLRGEGMGVTLNGIAQGYAADRALHALRSHGVRHALVDTGEIGGMGRPWRVGIQHPRDADAFLELVRHDGRCLATSGDYATNNHIFDPRTREPAAHFSSVTVAARTGMDADALSTALFVLGPAEGLRLIAATPGADALLVDKLGNRIVTEGFPRA